MKTPSIETISRMFGCTPEQVRSQFSRNASQLRGMADKASISGRRVNGFTASELSSMADKQEGRSRE